MWRLCGPYQVWRSLTSALATHRRQNICLRLFHAEGHYDALKERDDQYQRATRHHYETNRQCLDDVTWQKIRSRRYKTDLFLPPAMSPTRLPTLTPSIRTIDRIRYHLPEIRRPIPSHRVPTLLSRETSHITTNGAADRNVGESLVPSTVNPRIQKTHGLQPGGNAGIVEQGDDGCKSGGRGGGAADGDNAALIRDHIVVALSGNILES